MITIHVSIQKKVPTNLRLSRILERTSYMLRTLEQVHFFHVLRENNKEVDFLGNLASTLLEGFIKDVNDSKNFAAIP